MKEEIRKSNFVIAEHNSRNETQTVQIYNWILVNIGKGHYDIEQRIMFWKTYWKMIYKEITKLQMTDINTIKTRFIKGTFCKSLTICMAKVIISISNTKFLLRIIN